MIPELQVAFAGFLIAVTSILLYGLQIFKDRMGKQDAQLQSIHFMVNGTRTALLDQISQVYDRSKPPTAANTNTVDLTKTVGDIHTISSPTPDKVV